ncbi:MAG: hypothetical protein COB04_06695 [Gammaproteobacteria bacterium]|nr:MAG: hypothetical protein COB04_06695 [Gammaproteobacteria bacterium]
MRKLVWGRSRAGKGLQIIIAFLWVSGAHAAFWDSEKKEYESIEWKLPSAKFSDLGLSPKKVAEIANGGQFVVVSKPQDFTFWNARQKELQDFKQKRVTYVATVIPAPLEEVRAMVWDLEGQEKYSPLLFDNTNISTNGNVRIGSYEQIIKAPIIKLASDFIVQLNKYDSGDIGMVLIDEGDIESMYQYWEFFPLDDNRTLTVLSGWQDTDSASLVYKVILEAEPAIGKIFPILTMYERIVQFKNEAARLHPEIAEPADGTVYDIKSINGYVSDNKALDIDVIRKLSELGSIQFYQEVRKLSHEGELQNVIQVSALQYVDLPKRKIQPLLNDFSSLAEYNELTYGWLDNAETEEDWGHLQIAVNIGPFKIPIEIYITLEDFTDNKMIFYTADHSYMHPLFGHVEYVEVANDPENPDDDGAIVELTIGGVVGPEASFIFKMARYLPFHNVLIAAAYAMLTADSMEDWVVARVASDNMKAKDDKLVSNF